VTNARAGTAVVDRPRRTDHVRRRLLSLHMLSTITAITVRITARICICWCPASTKTLVLYHW